jgi:hypothetical protein
MNILELTSLWNKASYPTSKRHDIEPDYVSGLKHLV